MPPQERENETLLRIGQLARRAGVSVQAVRFYERSGLLPEPERRPSGYRAYPPGAVRRLRFIRRAKEVGFSLREIRELLSLRVEPGCTCGAIKARVTRKVEEVDARLAELQRIRDALLTLAEACSGRGPTTECPILDALDGAEVEANDGAQVGAPAPPPKKRTQRKTP